MTVPRLYHIRRGHPTRRASGFVTVWTRPAGGDPCTPALGQCAGALCAPLPRRRAQSRYSSPILESFRAPVGGGDFSCMFLGTSGVLDDDLSGP